MEKQRLLYQQSRLHDRGAAEMVLQMISACKGTQMHTHTDSDDDKWYVSKLVSHIRIINTTKSCEINVFLCLLLNSNLISTWM